MRGRHDLTDAEWAIISPLPPDKPRGDQRVDDRRVISGIFHILRTGTPWRDLPERYRPYTTVCNRCNRWARQGVWERLFEVLAAHSPGYLHLLDSSVVRAHQYAAGGKKGVRAKPPTRLLCPPFLTALSRPGTPSPPAAATPAPSSNASPTMALAPTSRPNGVAGSSARCPITCTANATSSNASSTSSNTSEASRPAITSLQETSSPQSPLPASASGSKSMSTRPRRNHQLQSLNRRL